MTQLPMIIQGGMGVAISHYGLANAVSREGHLGVISGTAIGSMLANRLQAGDPNGDMRRAMAAFPYQEPVQRILDRYYVEGGLGPDGVTKIPQMWTLKPSQKLNELTVMGNFVEVWLAKEGHDNMVGINLLEKVQLPNLASLYGAMLAGVDVVIMGAGIPLQIPGALDRFENHQSASYRIDVQKADADDNHKITFDPEAVFPGIAEKMGPLKRPMMFPIISSIVLAKVFITKATGPVPGFVIETPIAGGHNAPPRGKVQYNEDGEPIYHDKDYVDLDKMNELGYPYWLAGGYGNPEMLVEALEAGAQGIQVGTAFAFSEDSGMDPTIRQQVIDKVLAGEAVVRTSPVASPTGFPFKVADVDTTLSNIELYDQRERVCNQGFLRHPYKQEDGKIGYRCPAEPVAEYVKKGGKEEDTERRTCLCNNLVATSGFPTQRRSGGIELPIVTAGDDLPNIKRLFKPGERSYTAKDVLAYLTSKVAEPAPMSAD